MKNMVLVVGMKKIDHRFTFTIFDRVARNVVPCLIQKRKHGLIVSLKNNFFDILNYLPILCFGAQNALTLF